MSENVQRCAMASSKKPKRAFSINLFGFLDSETINRPWIHWMCRLYPWPTAFRTCWRPWSILSILPFHFKTQPYLYAVVKRHAVIVKTCSFNNLKPLAVPPVVLPAIKEPVQNNYSNSSITNAAFSSTRFCSLKENNNPRATRVFFWGRTRLWWEGFINVDCRDVLVTWSAELLDYNIGS